MGWLQTRWENPSRPGDCVLEWQSGVWFIAAPGGSLWILENPSQVHTQSMACPTYEAGWNSQPVESHVTIFQSGLGPEAARNCVCVLGGSRASAKWMVFVWGCETVCKGSPPRLANLLCDLGPAPQLLWTLLPECQSRRGLLKHYRAFSKP